MLGYYFHLALRSFRRNRIVSALMVLAIALGIGTSITMLTVLHNLSGDPLPQLSPVLYHPQIDPRPAKLPGADPDPPDDLTWVDASALYRQHAAPEQVMTSANWLPARRGDDDSALDMLTTRATTHELFSMFGMRFLYGQAWGAAEDDAHGLVVVISRKLNDSLFGGANSVGRTLLIATKRFRIIGVIDDWNPQPRFYDLNSKAYGDAEQLYLPFNTWLDLPQDYGYGAMQCWGRNESAGVHDPKAVNCTWVQYWVRLNSRTEVNAYRQSLVNYSDSQHQLGRFERAPNVALRGLIDWLDYKRAVPATVRMQTWISFAVLLVCLVNAVGLMGAKFMRNAGEIGVRRALGASRRAVFAQCLTDAGVIGITGGLLGIPFAAIGLWLVRQQPMAYASGVHLDMVMLGAALGISLLSSLAAGVWPAWHASRIAPALQVKSL